MGTLASKSIYRAVASKILAWGALSVGVTASPLAAQNIIGGNFTLSENTRFGNTVLRAGQYNFSVEPIGAIQSVRSIQQGAGHFVLVVLKPEKSGPVATLFAMASPSDRASEPSELILEPEKEEMAARSLHLEKEGLRLNFNWSGPQSKRPVVALKIAPMQAVAEPRTKASE